MIKTQKCPVFGILRQTQLVEMQASNVAILRSCWLIIVLTLIKLNKFTLGIASTSYFHWNGSSFVTIPFPINDSYVYLNYNTNPVTLRQDINISRTVQSDLVVTLLKGKLNGFYVDLATNDWNSASNTIIFDVYYNWTGTVHMISCLSL